MFDKLTEKIPGPNPLKKSLTTKEFAMIPELQNNPFRDRIANIYSRNDTESIGFEEYLDFLSVFSEEATRDVKAFYAFKIYDFDNDGYIGKEDVKQTLQTLVGDQLTDMEIAKVVERVFEEADIDGDERLSFVEFEHVINRAADFETLFRINAV